MSAVDPERVKKIAPWLTDKEVETKVKGKETKDLPKGLGLPPYHWNCRTLTVGVDEEEAENKGNIKEELSDLQKEVKEKIKDMYGVEMPENFYKDDFENGLNVRLGSDTYYTHAHNRVTIDTRRFNTDYLKKSAIAHEGGHSRHFQQGRINTETIGDETLKKSFIDHRKIIEDMVTPKDIDRVKNKRKFKEGVDRSIYELKLKLEGNKEVIKILENEGYSGKEIKEMKLSTADFFGALTKNAVGHGHERTYYKNSAYQSMEWFTHCSENYYVGNRFFELVFPELYEESIKVIKGLAR